MSKRESDKEEMLFIGLGVSIGVTESGCEQFQENHRVKLSGLIGKYGCGEEELQAIFVLI